MPNSAERAGPRRVRWGLLAAILYILLLIVSHGVRRAGDDSTGAVSGSREVLSAVRGAKLLEEPVELGFRDTGPADETRAVVLFHGSPGNRHDFDGMLDRLSSRRLIIPDLPGFGESSRSVPDYSVRAHARYTLQLLDRLGIREVDLVGFSMGGGVALNLHDLAPERVRSLTLLSAIGVQELELFGDYRLNHLVHGAQLAAFWLAREGLPHMGLLDDTMLSVEYCRNFFDTDQRPLRGMLENFEQPLLIVHGETDFLVPPEAAIEHHRIVPHSELQMLDAGHFMVFMQGPRMASILNEFLGRVDGGLAPRRGEAEARRISAAAAPFDPRSAPAFTGFALFLMMALIAVATMISEDLTCIAVGLMAAQGRIGFVPGVVACFVGIYVGDLLLYAAGRFLGRPAVERRPLRWLVTPEQVEISSRWFARRGPVVIGLSRFIPGTRLPTYFAAGLLRTGFWSFCFYFFIAVAVWTPILVGLSMFLGEQAYAYFDSFKRHALPAFLLFALWILLVIKVGLPMLTHTGRRKLLGKWRRVRRWEFWPPWLFYPPVVAYVLWLGLRYRGPLLFTAANPAIEASGFIAESKREILEGLASTPEYLAAWTFVPQDEDVKARIAVVKAFMSGQGIDYPVVLKPDAGQRGSGVAVVRDEDQLEVYLSRSKYDVIAQVHVPGKEFGVFYYRYPDEAEGRIFSITDKQIPTVTGDGVQRIEQLILADERAICMVDHYLRFHSADLERVPERGEVVPLVELGTHCRGAVFMDGARVETPELARAIDEISRGYDGFYFGRYDIRTPDVEQMRRGLGFKIIELNGVTSEATHIYDPGVGLFEAYRTLFEQWRVAFAIGHSNRARGTSPVGLAELVRLSVRYRRTSSTHQG